MSPSEQPRTQPGADVPAAIRQGGGEPTAYCLGDWSAEGVAGLARKKGRLGPETSTVDLSGVERFDSTGAVYLTRLLADVPEARVTGERSEWSGLLALVREETDQGALSPHHGRDREGLLQWLGRVAMGRAEQLYAFMTFVGETTLDVAATFPRLRLRQVALELQRAGAHALPITGLLSFLVGVVMAYQGGTTLQNYGANIFLVDLIGITMLREMAPLLVAIIVAGRTGSAYAAELGTMRITEELDALRSIGVTPFEMLVVPKILALVLALPLLSVWADATGVLGGMVVAEGYYGVSFATFISRFPDVVAGSHFLIGIGKAPAFAILIGAIGCFQGLQARGSAADVGRATTWSVVQSIFAVIVADALFSIAFQYVGF